MNATIILYIAKVSIAIFMFYGIYILFLRKDTFNKTKRFYLLFSVLASLLLPLCSVNLSMLQSTSGLFAEVFLPEVFVTPGDGNNMEIAGQEQGRIINFSTILIYILTSGVILFFIKFIIQLSTIVKIKLDSDAIRDRNTIVVLMNDNVVPFSFFNWIFLPKKHNNTLDMNAMIAHEKIHSQQMHSFDVMLSELFCIFFWWNPIAWLIKKEIQVNLEYLADEGVLLKGYEPKAYQYLLLQITNSNASIQIVNYFNVSQLKKRIIMINKEKSRKILTTKYLLVLPIAMLMLLLNIACSKTDKTPLENEHNTVASIKEPEVKVSEPEVSGTEDIVKMKPFQTVEVMPKYPGGDKELLQYISENLKYPEVASNGGVEGLVVVRFVISEVGKISDVVILRSLSPECDAEAIRVVNGMPQWTPGKQNGQNVAVYYTLPIRYQLQK